VLCSPPAAPLPPAPPSPRAHEPLPRGTPGPPAAKPTPLRISPKGALPMSDIVIFAVGLILGLLLCASGLVN